MKKITVFVFTVLLIAVTQLGSAQSLQGQSSNSRPVSTTLSFLSITPDARAAGMGDVGVATSPTSNDIYWNPAKLAFNDSKIGASLSFTPWLSKLVNDMSISYLAGHYKLDDKQAIGLGVRYFNLGDITFTNTEGNITGNFVPREFSTALTYSRKLSENLGVAVSGRYIHSNVTGGITLSNQEVSKPVNTVAADIAVFYTKPIYIAGKEVKWNLGANISNIGPKVSYTDQNNRDFIPTNLRFGTAFTVDIDEHQKITWAVDFNKLMVPTPPQTDAQGNIIKGTSPRDKTLLSGMFGSFGDAPDGLSEELKEVIWSTGVEYWYRNAFVARAGYFSESVDKGNRKYFSVGAGIKYTQFGLDVAYLLATDQANPLAETLRFSLTFDLSGKKKK
ncbi:type IX secretion system outer membrane channel protein PorV [uncultured Microscilla sp.]|uniref:type IX secretion system outer membrane channel protein PorV n=1 Tax=uncultured Microscilla sp. TaxID=432653 RepID=UPI00262A0545|nr:type IX secretion system outer membrane channel protein PorV [uncultured Microscilla sp.]